MTFSEAKLVQIEKKVDIGNSVVTKTLQQQIFTSSGTWTKPASVTEVWITAQGGGGGGGQGATSAPREEKAGGGGDGGGCVQREHRPVTGNLSVTVGAAGAANSGDGTDSVVNTTPEVRAVGGEGGLPGATIYDRRTIVNKLKRLSVYPGGQDTVLNSLTGSFSEAGKDSNVFVGGVGGVQSATITGGGGGGSTPFGKGGAGGNQTLAGSAATGYGAGGGGGGGDASSSKNGGAGTAGIVIIEWYE